MPTRRSRVNPTNTMAIKPTSIAPNALITGETDGGADSLVVASLFRSKSANHDVREVASEGIASVRHSNVINFIMPNEATTVTRSNTDGFESDLAALRLSFGLSNTAAANTKSPI